MTDQKTQSGLSASTVHRGAFAVIGFLAASELTSGLIQTWYIPLLGQIGQKFTANPAQLNWVQASYLLSTVVCVPLLAKLGDKYGHRRMVLIVLGTVTVGTVMTALAPSFGIFLLGRIIQGTLGALLPLELAILRERAGAGAGRAIGILVGCLGAGGAIGTLLAGILGTNANLTLVLLLPAVLALASLVLIAYFVPETSSRTTGSIDWIGAALLGVGLAVFLVGISNGNKLGWTSTTTLMTIGGGAVLLVAFVATEKKISTPLVDLSLLTKGGVGFLLGLTSIFGVQFYGSAAVAALYYSAKPDIVGYGFGLDSMGIALAISPAPLALMISSSFADSFSRRVGTRTALQLSSLLIVVWFCGLIAFRHNLPAFISMGIIGGLGTGIFVALLPALVISRARPEDSAIAGALYNTSRTMAGAIAGAAFAAIMSGMLMSGSKIPSESAFITIWAVCIGVCVLIFALVPFLNKLGGKAYQPESPEQVIDHPVRESS
ncbi:MFS transporter [Rhodococcus sp. (in: high G+C Gram-positive bacteria)]|uniref:MFS transporter n=1 Tax=Rhodococcus sp. TaxID=1831 RepID=UPI002580DC89|nr:MFS transporter [Rhodococcus sp. (in: high G+C Gram-positive bacteria)]